MNSLLWFKCNNFGDSLSPLIFEHFSESKAIFTDVEENHKKYVSTGSILNHAKSDDIVWGSGIARSSDNINKGVDIRAVRGPRTRKRCVELNIDCPEVYGDPALILPKIYKPKVQKRYTIGFTPHIVDYEQCKNQYSTCENSIIIDFKEDPYKIIRKILSCDYIISSSLHGLIVADAYSIPNLWVKFSNKVLGDDTKFFDHLETVKKNKTTFIDCRSDSKTNNELLSHLNEVEMSKYTEEDLNNLIKACPFKV